MRAPSAERRLAQVLVKTWMGMKEKHRKRLFGQVIAELSPPTVIPITSDPKVDDAARRMFIDLIAGLDITRPSPD